MILVDWVIFLTGLVIHSYLTLSWFISCRKWIHYYFTSSYYVIKTILAYVYDLPKCIKLAYSQLYTFRQVSLYAYWSCPPSSKIDDMEKNMISALDGVPLLLIHWSVHPSKISSIPHNTPSLDTSFTLQGSWMLIERGLQAHRWFGQTKSIMVIEHFHLEQLTWLKVTSQTLQYIVIFYIHNLWFWDFSIFPKLDFVTQPHSFLLCPS